MNGAPGQAAATTGPVLRDIHLPPPPSWWPPAPGWWISAVLLLLAISLGVWLWRRQHRRRALERTMLAEVDALVSRGREQPQQLAAGLHQLLRRGALRLDAAAAQQSGEAWRRTLATVAVDASTLDRLMLLESVMYRPDALFDVDASVAATRRWLQLAWRHRGRNAQATRVFMTTSVPESAHG